MQIQHSWEDENKNAKQTSNFHCKLCERIYTLIKMSNAVRIPSSLSGSGRRRKISMNILERDSAASVDCRKVGRTKKVKWNDRDEFWWPFESNTSMHCSPSSSCLLSTGLSASATHFCRIILIGIFTWWSTPKKYGRTTTGQQRGRERKGERLMARGRARIRLNICV